LRAAIDSGAARRSRAHDAEAHANDRSDVAENRDALTGERPTATARKISESRPKPMSAGGRPGDDQVRSTRTRTGVGPRLRIGDDPVAARHVPQTSEEAQQTE
jgi:hypothetical protein